MRLKNVTALIHNAIVISSLSIMCIGCDNSKNTVEENKVYSISDAYTNFQNFVDAIPDSEKLAFYYVAPEAFSEAESYAELLTSQNKHLAVNRGFEKFLIKDNLPEDQSKLDFSILYSDISASKKYKLVKEYVIQRFRANYMNGMADRLRSAENEFYKYYTSASKSFFSPARLQAIFDSTLRVLPQKLSEDELKLRKNVADTLRDIEIKKIGKTFGMTVTNRTKCSIEGFTVDFPFGSRNLTITGGINPGVKSDLTWNLSFRNDHDYRIQEISLNCNYNSVKVPVMKISDDYNSSNNFYLGVENLPGYTEYSEKIINNAKMHIPDADTDLLSNKTRLALRKLSVMFLGKE